MEGVAELPFVMTVNPKGVDDSAARLPLPFGFMVMMLPLVSQLGVPFQGVETFCGAHLVFGGRPSAAPTASTARS